MRQELCLIPTVPPTSRKVPDTFHMVNKYLNHQHIFLFQIGSSDALSKLGSWQTLANSQLRHPMVSTCAWQV